MSKENVVTSEHIKEAGRLLKTEHLRRLELEKEAQAFNLEKRAQTVAFKEIELGLAEPFKNYQEFQQKVASLMQEDLDVVEKALERGYAGISQKRGELVNGKTAPGMSALENYVLTGQFELE